MGEGELVFVKLGGALITDKAQVETPRRQVIARLASEVEAARRARPGLRLVLGHGSGSFGHVAAARFGTRQGVQDAEGWQGFARVADVAARLNRLVAAAFLDAGVPVWSLQPSASARCRAGTLVWLNAAPIAAALDRGLVPLVYGDVALDETQGGTIVSTEEIFAYLARELPADRLILMSEVDGVYDADPQLHPGARRFDRITTDSWDAVWAALGGAAATDVTGGMLTKVAAMVAWVAAGSSGAGLGAREARLLSGHRAGALLAALLEPDRAGGTVIRRA